MRPYREAGRRPLRTRAAAVFVAIGIAFGGMLTLRGAGPTSAAGAGDVTPPSLGFALEWTGPNSPVHDVILLWDDRLDQTHIPDPADFVVRFDGVPQVVDSVEFSHDGTYDPTLSITFMTLYLHDPVIPSGGFSSATFTVDYTPGTYPVKDQAGNQAVTTPAVPIDVLETPTFEPVIGIVDGFYGADHVGLVFSDPVDPASIPSPAAFTVTRNGNPLTVTGATVFPAFGGRIIDLALSSGFRSGDTGTISYTAPGTGGVRNLVNTAAADFPETGLAILLAAQDQVSQALAAGDTITTDAGPSGTTAQDPVATTVGVPAAATVSIDEGGTVLPPSTPDYTFIGETVEISVSLTSTPDAPIAIDFSIDQSILAAAGVTPATVQIFRDGVLVAPCAGASGVADPDPCVESRTAVPAAPDPLAYAVIRVLTSHASTWNFASFVPYAWSGFLAPVDIAPTVNVVKAGSAVPVKFSLGSDRGLAIFAAGSPSSRVISCDAGVPADAIEETVSPGAATLTYDATSGRYTYVWKTAGEWTGCRRLTLTMIDGSTHSADFRFR